MHQSLKNIVILDDHKLFRDSLVGILTEHFMPVSIQQFVESSSALHYIEQCKINGQQIDLIITDQNHPGMSGFAFAAACRKLERQYNSITPLLLMSMTINESDDTKLIGVNTPTEKNPFNLKLSKLIETNRLIESIAAVMNAKC